MTEEKHTKRNGDAIGNIFVLRFALHNGPTRNARPNKTRPNPFIVMGISL